MSYFDCLEHCPMAFTRSIQQISMSKNHALFQSDYLTMTKYVIYISELYVRSGYPTHTERRSPFMKWLFKLFRGSTSCGKSNGRRPRIIGEESMLHRPLRPVVVLFNLHIILSMLTWANSENYPSSLYNIDRDQFSSY